jgi:hypothetical protein
VPNLQVGGQVVQFLASRGFPIPSPAVINRIGDVTPSPSAVTDNPCDHEVRFTRKVLLSLAGRDPRQASFSQARSTFQLINTALARPAVNVLG